MSRLDLSIYNKVDAEDWHERLRLEAIRAQRSEDELKERVRVLEEAIATAIPKLRQIASDQYQYDMAKYIADDLRALAGGKEEGVCS